jgi:cytoskeletal protein RodZ
MDFDKAYKEYLAWRLSYIQSQKKTDIGFDRHYFEAMKLDELIWFRESFIEKTSFVPAAKEVVVETMDMAINNKKEQRRDEMLCYMLGK